MKLIKISSIKLISSEYPILPKKWSSSEHSSKIITPEKIIPRLLITLPQEKAGHTSEKLLIEM